MVFWTLWSCCFIAHRQVRSPYKHMLFIWLCGFCATLTPCLLVAIASGDLCLLILFAFKWKICCLFMFVWDVGLEKCLSRLDFLHLCFICRKKNAMSKSCYFYIIQVMLKKHAKHLICIHVTNFVLKLMLISVYYCMLWWPT